MQQTEMGNNVKQLIQYKKTEFKTSGFWYNIEV